MERNDEILGRLERISHIVSHSWDTSVSIPYFRGSGKYVKMDMGQRKSDRLDTERLFRRGCFRLSIDTNDSGAPPTEAQRTAWQRVLERGDALWDELMQNMLAEYKRQRPARVRAWRQTFGNRSFRWVLPEVNRFEDMKKLVRPYMIYMSRPDHHESPVIDVMFLSRWFNGLHARIVDGRFHSFRRNVMRGRPDDLPPEIHHRELGPLAWHKDRWYGITSCEPLREYIQSAYHTARLINEPEDYRNPNSRLPYDLARGEFTLTIASPAEKAPTPKQASALKKFKAREAESIAKIVAAIFAQYVRMREKWLDKYFMLFEEELPPLQSPGELAQVMRLDSINITSGNSPRVELDFDCTWDSWLRVVWKYRNSFKIRNEARRKPLKKRRGRRR